MIFQLAIGNDLARMTRLELENQLIENRSAFHFAFIPMFQNGARGEIRTPTRLILSQLPLPHLGYTRNEFCELVPAEGFEPTLSSS